jgi:TonB family protein
MDRVRIQISELLPDPSFGEDIRDHMTTCTKTGCLQMNSVLAMARLKTRVNPEINAALQGFMHGSQVTVRVKARIDESGNVTVSETEGGNPTVNAAVRSAVDRWKFNPIIDQTGSRCVDTEIPIFLRF